MPETVIAGRYRLDELLGRGGMSEVWCADDLELGRRVALKLLAPDADTARFEREAHAVASLAHPNVTQLYDYGESDGRPYMVLEYLPGGTLEDRLEPGKPLPDGDTSAIAAGVAAGLAHAHSRGVVHRDLKPANVLFDEEGRPKLADFGIARVAAREGTLTEAGTLLGTATYISPEQASGLPATAASDVYSFGVILYRLLTGRLPFESNDPMHLLALHQTAEPVPIRELRRDAPGRLEATATAALAKEPAARPADGAALLAELGVAAGTLAGATADLGGGEPTRVLPAAAAASPPPPPPPRRRVPRAAAAAAILLLALAGAALAYEVTRPSSDAPAATTGTLPTLHIPSATRHRTTAPTTTRTPTTLPATTTPPATSTAQTTTAATTTRSTTTHQTTTAPPPPPTTTYTTTTTFTTTTAATTTAATTTAATTTG